MGEFHLSKTQVLKEIYIRELPLIFKHIRQRKRLEQLEEVAKYNRLLDIAVSTAGMSPSIENVKALKEEFRQLAKSLAPAVRVPEKKNTGDPLNGLRALQGVIAANRPHKPRKG